MIVYAVNLEMSLHFTVRSPIVVFLTDFLVFWLAFVSLVGVLVMGTLWWRKENRFYRVFIPLAFVGIILSWAVECASRYEVVWKQIIGNLSSGQVLYLYSHTLSGIIGAALLTAVVEAVRTELDRRAEQKLLEQRKELTMASYESMRVQHEEVMKLRHDMASHYEAIRNMTADPKTAAYLDTLIGQSKKVRAIIHTGNQTLDIILNGKLSAAMDAGICVNVQRSYAPETLDIEDADLCSLMMNMMNNAITGAKNSGVDKSFITIDIHVKDHWLVINCTNSADVSGIFTPRKEETVPKHGLGLKIMEDIANRYQGIFSTETVKRISR